MSRLCQWGEWFIVSLLLKRFAHVKYNVAKTCRSLQHRNFCKNVRSSGIAFCCGALVQDSDGGCKCTKRAVIYIQLLEVYWSSCQRHRAETLKASCWQMGNGDGMSANCNPAVQAPFRKLCWFWIFPCCWGPFGSWGPRFIEPSVATPLVRSTLAKLMCIVHCSVLCCLQPPPMLPSEYFSESFQSFVNCWWVMSTS